MTCPEYREILFEAGRGAKPAPGVAAHARECRACRVFVENERSLTEGLIALAQLETRGPSASLEAALLRELKPVQRRGWKWVAGVAATVGLTMLFAPRPAIHAPRAATMPESIVAAVSPAPAIASVRDAKEPRHLPAHRRHRSAVPADAAAEFVGIPYSAPLDLHERAELVRVNMPIATLAAWGLSVPGADPQLRVDADLVLGGDGLARAVRLVR